MKVSVTGGIPTAVLDSVKTSLNNSYSAYFNEKPKFIADHHGPYEGACIAGIISFLGELNWSLSWILTRDIAPVIARKFAGFDIPLDSADMGDVAGELVNVLAGDIVAQMEQRGYKTQMSLPTIVRGNPLTLVPEEGPAVENLKYVANEGVFWFRIAAASNHSLRMSGK